MNDDQPPSPTPPQQYDLFRAEERKHVGQFLTSINNADWMEAALWCARHYLPQGELMGEDLRRVIAPLIGEPTSPGHTWGSLTTQVITRGIIEHTGRYKRSTALRNNGHKYEIYRKPTPATHPLPPGHPLGQP